MTEKAPLHLFEGIGIELEYMIVDAEQLDVLPVCDQVMAAEAGEITAEIEFPDISWNNELVLHVIELKTTEPVESLTGLGDRFREHLHRVGRRLGLFGGRLMPTSMHPWMDPAGETRLWPHELGSVYKAFDRIFDCRGHGWSNLQSLHINLPFADDDEFGRLHAAIRLLLPVLPALAASSPIVDGRITGSLDSRLGAYLINCARIPSVTGRFIPEPVFTIDAYHERVLNVIYDALEPHDPDSILRHDWVNARGAIPRFERQSLEIRALDVQECPAADLAVAAAVVAVLKLIVAETFSDLRSQQAWPVEPLVSVFEATMKLADLAIIDDPDYLQSLGWIRGDACSAGELWKHLIETARCREPGVLDDHEPALSVLLREGCLARRILRSVPAAPAAGDLRKTYGRLCDCLTETRMFRASVA